MRKWAGRAEANATFEKMSHFPVTTFVICIRKTSILTSR